MPLTPTGIIIPLVSNLVSTAHLGSGVPKLAKGIAFGLMAWAPKIKATTVDAGQFGVGRGVAIILIPPQVLIAALTATFTSQKMLGVFAPLTILGLSNGLSTALLQGQVVTTHPIIGSGKAVVKLTPAPAVPSFLEGFNTAGMTGEGSQKMAKAVGYALHAVFSALVLPAIITGAGSPVSGVGSGSGQIV